MDNMKEFLRSTEIIDSDSPIIKEKTEIITKNAVNTVDRAVKLFYNVRDSIKYKVFSDWPEYGDFRASNAANLKSSFCIPKSVLLVAMSRAAEIPARLHFANIRNHLLPPDLIKVIGTDLMVYHGYAELYINGKWVKATPSFDLNLCKRHNFIPVDFNGLDDAILHQYDKKGRKHVEYVEDRGFCADFTRDLYKKIKREWIMVYSSFTR